MNNNTAFLRSTIIASLLSTLMFSADPSLADDAEVIVELESTQVYLGESVAYRVLLNQFDNDATPVMPQSSDVEFRLLQKTISNSVFTQSNGFSQQRVVRKGPEYRYALTPKRAGSLKIAGPTAILDGTTIRGREVELKVKAPDSQDLVKLQVVAEPVRVYPTQKFEIALDVLVKGLPDYAADRDPLEVQRRLPSLSIPWVDDDTLPDAIEPVVPWGRWLTQYVNESGGVAINNLQQQRDLISEFFNRDPMDLLGGGTFETRRESRIPFRSKPERQFLENLRGRRVEYWKYRFVREFEAVDFGTHEFGPVTLKGAFGSRLDTRGNLNAETVFAVAPAVTVEIIPPPTKGRPPEYVGAIGRFTAGAEIHPQEAKVGDPMTLTLWIEGSGTLDAATAPQLNRLSEIERHFKVYDATEETSGERRLFTYSLRPKNDQVSEFPPVSMAYFDVRTEKYVSIKSPPLPLSIGASEALRSGDIQVASPTKPSSYGLEISEDGIFANITDLKALKNESVQPDRWLLTLLGMAGSFVVVVFAKQHRDRTRHSPESRNRRAELAARSNLKELQDAAESLDAKTFADRSANILITLIAELKDLSSEVFTTGDAVDQLREEDVSNQTIDRVQSLLQECDAVRYGSLNETRNDLLERIQGSVDEILQQLRRK